MKTYSKALALGLVVAAGAALAHENVKNPVVKERMMAMKTVGANTKVLGQMAKGEVAFDAARAAEATATLVATAGQVPALFEAPETDPVSEAKPEIWSNWDDFVSKSQAMAAAAGAMDTSSQAGVQAGMGALGGSCKACHSDYRL